MNPGMVYENLIMGCKFAVFNEKNPFTDEQRKELADIIDEANLLPLNSKNPFVQLQNKTAFEKIANKFELKYEIWGGDIQLLKNAASEAENVAIPFLKQGKAIYETIKGKIQMRATI